VLISQNVEKTTPLLLPKNPQIFQQNVPFVKEQILPNTKAVPFTNN
jgi:hypothetical protein